MLKVTLEHHGARSRIELNGVDVSQFFRSVVIRADVTSATEALLEYTGAVVVEGEPGQFRMQQAEHLVRCDECQKTLGGEPQELKVFETTPFGVQYKTYACVKA